MEQMETERKKPGRKLYRSRRDRKIAGICGGLGDYFHIDAVWIRLIFVIFFIAGGSALLVYLVMWLIVPNEPERGIPFE